MHTVNYDVVAPAYDRRYEINRYDGVRACLRGFLDGANALHHFQNRAAFIAECRRVLRPGGGLLTIGLDPHRGTDRWWIYDYFPAALEADLARYLSSSTIRDLLSDAGFQTANTAVAQHLPREIPFEVARQQGFVDRRATSQLIVISDEAFDSGMSRLIAEMPVLRADLTLYATTAWA